MGLMLSRIPILAWVVLGIGMWGAWGHFKSTRYEKQRAEMALEEARLVNRVRTRDSANIQKIESQYAQAVKKASMDVAKLRRTNDSLRNTLAQSGVDREATSACADNGEREQIFRELLVGSTELAVRGAEEVKRIAAKTAALQDYIKRVCLNNADNKD